MDVTKLPKLVIQQIGTHLDTRDRNSARCAGRMFDDIHAGVRQHTLVFHSFSMPSFAQRCNTVAKLMPCLSKLILVFKNLTGPTDPSIELNALDMIEEKGCMIDVAFEYCDEAFIVSIFNTPWHFSSAYIWFHNDTVTPVVPELHAALQRRQIPFSSRFNSKQAPSLLCDPNTTCLLQAAHYVVHGNHFTTLYSFMEPPHVIDIPTDIPQVYLELLHYNVLVTHPERVTHVSFIAQDMYENEMIESNRSRLAAWFNAESLRALEGVDIYTLSFSTIRSACFARHVFETLRAMHSRAVVRIYNCIQSNCMCLLQQFPDISIVIVAKTDHTYLIGRLVMHFLGKRNLLHFVVDESYVPPNKWKCLQKAAEIYAELPAVLKEDWYWVQFLV